MKTNLATYLTSLLASGFLLLTAGLAHGETEAPDAAAIKKTAEDFHRALAGGKSDQVMALLHVDALIVEGGTVQTREEYKREHLPADIAYAAAVPGKQLNAVVQQDGDVAWVTSTFNVKGTFQSKEINDLAAETMVLIKTPAGWLIRSIHWSSQKVRKTKS